MVWTAPMRTVLQHPGENGVLLSLLQSAPLIHTTSHLFTNLIELIQMSMMAPQKQLQCQVHNTWWMPLLPSHSAQKKSAMFILDPHRGFRLARRNRKPPVSWIFHPQGRRCLGHQHKKIGPTACSRILKGAHGSHGMGVHIRTKIQCNPLKQLPYH